MFPEKVLRMTEKKEAGAGRPQLVLPAERVLGWLMLAGFYACDVLFMWRKGRSIIDSDASSEMVLSSLLNREGRFVTTSWFYSTELRIVNNQPVYQLALRVFPGDWHKARVLAAAVLLLVLIACIFVFCAAIGHLRSGCYIACAVICPICPYYASHISFKSHYIPYLCVSLITLSACVSAVKSKNAARKCLAAGAAFILAAASCLNGLRMLMVCYVPLFAAAAVLVYLRREDERCRKLFYISALLLAAGGAGYVVNAKFLSRLFSFANYSVSTLKGFTVQGFLITVQNLITLYGGWRETADIRFMSICGLAYYWGLVLFLAVFCAMFCFLRRFRELSFEDAVLTAFSAMLFLCLLLTLSQIDPTEGAKPYWIPFVPFSFFFPVLYLERKERFRWAAVFTASFLLCALYTAKFPYVRQFPAGERLAGAVEWLEANGYRKGAATFWNSNVVTELSDGAIEMWTVQSAPLPELDIYEWLQECSHRTLPEGEFFLLIGRDDKNSEAFDEEGWEQYMRYEDDKFRIYLFDEMSSLTALIR